MFVISLWRIKLALKNIENFSLFTHLKQPSIEGRVGKPEFPVVALIDNDEVIAAIKIKMNAVWHVENVTAKYGYGPTIYKILMDLSGDIGIAPAFKYAKDRKDFVVPKSRNIWLEFSKSNQVSIYFLSEKYQDSILNNRFISEVPMSGIGEAKKNLKNKIRCDYIKNLSFYSKFISMFKRRKIDLRYRDFIYNYQLRISRIAKALLEQSVLAHS